HSQSLYIPGYFATSTFYPSISILRPLSVLPQHCSFYRSRWSKWNHPRGNHQPATQWLLILRCDNFYSSLAQSLPRITKLVLHSSQPIGFTSAKQFRYRGTIRITYMTNTMQRYRASISHVKWKPRMR
ncbi:hypothetical protein PENTCL1PPCAC_2953, partial [Pristionchus entomophagus]